jgi:hypothetical protein
LKFKVLFFLIELGTLMTSRLRLLFFLIELGTLMTSRLRLLFFLIELGTLMTSTTRTQTLRVRYSENSKAVAARLRGGGLIT